MLTLHRAASFTSCVGQLSSNVRPLKHTMRCILTILIASLPFAANAAPIPDLICREGRVRHVDPKTLQTKEYESSTTYRFNNRKLYLKSPGRGEHLYGSVSETEPGKYAVGHKTIYLATQQTIPILLQLTHVYIDEIRVSLAECEKQ